MLSAFDRTLGKLVPCDVDTEAAWIHVRDPDRAEIDAVASQLDMSPHLFRDALDVDEIARVSEHDNSPFLIVLRVPWLCGEPPVLRSTAFSIFIVKDRVVTVTRDDVDVLAALVVRARDRFEPGIPLAVAAIHVVAEQFLHHLRGIEERIDHLEVKIESDLSNKTILALLLENKNLIHLEAALESDKIAVKELRESLAKRPNEDLDEAADELRQAMAVTRVERESLAQTMSAFGSIVSNNLNDAMKFLTSLTIILMVPTIVAGIWGMNVGLPLEENPIAFWYLIGATAIACVLTTVVLRRRNWL